MSDTAEKIDVRAVMDALSGVLRADWTLYPERQFEAARAAMDELIEADAEYDAARDALDRANYGSESTECWNRLVRAKERRSAALARVRSS